MSTSTGDGAEGAKPVTVNLEKVQLVQHQGMTLPQYLDPVEVQVQKIKDMEIRDSDVLLCTYPKSGTHWMYRVLDMLVSGRAEYSDRGIDLATIDLQPIDRIENADSPRVLVTHYPFDLLPDQVKAGKAKVVHVYRHPKAVMVSLFFHTQNANKIPGITLPMLEDMIFSEKALYRNMFYCFDKVKEFEKNYPDVSIHHVSFEDMKKTNTAVINLISLSFFNSKDTIDCIKKLAAYLNVGASDDLCSKIAETVSFEKQRQEEDKRHDEVQTKRNFYRKGEVSDWKNYLTVAQSERFDQVLSERADTCRFSARYRP